MVPEFPDRSAVASDIEVSRPPFALYFCLAPQSKLSKRVGEVQPAPCSASLVVSGKGSYHQAPFRDASGAGRARTLGFTRLLLDARRYKRRQDTGKDWVHNEEGPGFWITLKNVASGIGQLDRFMSGGELGFQG